VVAGVVALQTGAAAEAVQFVQNVIQRLPPRNGSHEEDGEDQGQSGQVAVGHRGGGTESALAVGAVTA
jgi:hypothetical protein